MKLSETLSDLSISRMLQLNDLASSWFGDELKMTTLTKNYKESYDGLIELKDGRMYKAKVRQKQGSSLTTWTHKFVGYAK